MAGGKSSVRIQSLDGLRALSILLVFLGHLKGTRAFPSQLDALGQFAELGVRVFFVISGYLITTLLFEDLRKIEAGTLTRGEALKQFYIRRAYRIFPAAYVLLLVVWILDAAGVITLAPHDLICGATYTQNFHLASERSWWLGHLWSLSVEEQFYLLWPAALLLLGRRRGMWVALGALAFAPAARFAMYFGMPAYRDGVGEWFPTIFDTIAAGCLLAGVRAWLHARPGYLRALQSPLFLVLPVAIFGAALLESKPLLDYGPGQLVQNLAIAVLIDRSITWPSTLWGRALNVRPLIFIGQLSYSLYLWQQLFINRHSDSWVSAFPVNLGLAFATACVSYYLVEQPVLRFRARRAAKLRVHGAEGPVAATP
ncbi:MAG TPA: acyltransferase [Kofleriaceae bacterium]|jgi:peptidoglycan/LPS O-acetylase OafA/YrhL